MTSSWVTISADQISEKRLTKFLHSNVPSALVYHLSRIEKVAIKKWQSQNMEIKAMDIIRAKLIYLLTSNTESMYFYMFISTLYIPSLVPQMVHINLVKQWKKEAEKKLLSPYENFDFINRRWCNWNDFTI